MKKIILLLVIAPLLHLTAQVPDKIELKNSYEEKVFIDFTADKEFSRDFESGISMWNDGEEFPSLGLGHYIWFPKFDDNSSIPFVESFPKMLQYMVKRDPSIDLKKVPIIGSLITINGEELSIEPAPWSSKKEFYADQRRYGLNIFLSDPTALSIQAHYQVSEYNNFLEKLILSYPKAMRSDVTNFINSLVTSIGGKVAIIDYTNFKGSGLNVEERYKGEGWGLKQLLAKAITYSTGSLSISRFSAAAKWVLERRIQNSPRARREYRWREGWFKRVEEYKNIK